MLEYYNQEIIGEYLDFWLFIQTFSICNLGFTVLLILIYFCRNITLLSFILIPFMDYIIVFFINIFFFYFYLLKELIFYPGLFLARLLVFLLIFVLLNIQRLILMTLWFRSLWFFKIFQLILIIIFSRRKRLNRNII